MSPRLKAEMVSNPGLKKGVLVKVMLILGTGAGFKSPSPHVNLGLQHNNVTLGFVTNLGHIVFKWIQLLLH